MVAKNKYVMHKIKVVMFSQGQSSRLNTEGETSYSNAQGGHKKRKCTCHALLLTEK